MKEQFEDKQTGNNPNVENINPLDPPSEFMDINDRADIDSQNDKLI